MKPAHRDQRHGDLADMRTVLVKTQHRTVHVVGGYGTGRFAHVMRHPPRASPFPCRNCVALQATVRWNTDTQVGRLHSRTDSITLRTGRKP